VGHARERERDFRLRPQSSRNGDHYWVFAHVTPNFDRTGQVVGYHSNRRVPYAGALPKVQSLYAVLLDEEKKHRERARAVAASVAMVVDTLKGAGPSYSEFVFSRSEKTRFGAAV